LTPAEIIAGLESKNRALTAKNDEYPGLVEKRAEAERAYNIAAAEKTMRLKMDGDPIGLISFKVAGDAFVSELKLKYEIAKGVEKANQTSIRILTSQIDTYRSLLSWLKAEMGRT
jgi:hypothetical protein